MPICWTRWKFRFGLRALLLSMAVLAVVLALVTNRWRHAVRQEKFVYDVLAAAGRVQYDDGWDPREIEATAISEEGCVTLFAIDMISSDALRKRNFWHDVVSVDLGRIPHGGENAWQQILDAIPNFRTIRAVGLCGPGVTSDVVGRLAVLRRMSDLRLYDVSVDDAMVDSLQRLPALRLITVSRQRKGSRDSHALQMAELARQLRASLPRVSVTIDEAVNAPP